MKTQKTMFLFRVMLLALIAYAWFTVDPMRTRAEGEAGPSAVAV